MKKTTFSSRFGFTLIEIVVVIAIIALLFAAGVTSYAKIRVNSRDSIRKSDLTAIRSALEQYRNINTAYPTTLSQLETDGYMPKQPMDPQLNCSYTYNVSTPPSAYTLCADFEGVGTFDCTITDCRVTCTPDCDEPSLKNLQ